MKRGLVLVGVAAGIFLTGCAKPSRPTADAAPDATTTTAAPASTATIRLATCVNVSAPPVSNAVTSAAAPTTNRPEPRLSGAQTEQDREELFRRNQEANKAFRNRHPLSPQVLAANQPCVDAVRAGLERLRAQNRYDAAAIQQVLNTAGLTSVVARPAVRLDLAGSGGLLFAGSTGQGCVFGEHGPASTTVQFGSGIADGGCLPAPD
jgi:hypothetical protein